MEIAEDGRPGILKALSGDFALIVLDVMMPDMSGFDVLRRTGDPSRNLAQDDAKEHAG